MKNTSKMIIPKMEINFKLKTNLEIKNGNNPKKKYNFKKEDYYKNDKDSKLVSFLLLATFLRFFFAHFMFIIKAGICICC